MVLVGAKCDLVNDRKIKKQEALDLAKSWNMPYFEVLKKNSLKLKNIFFRLVQKREKELKK
jgi:GTPase SAR1 family protein